MRCSVDKGNEVNISWYINLLVLVVVLAILLKHLVILNFNRARYLCDLLLPLIAKEYFCKDTFWFVSQIKSANPTGKFLVSCNVTILFTNIPLQKITDIAIKI